MTLHTQSYLSLVEIRTSLHSKVKGSFYVGFIIIVIIFYINDTIRAAESQ